MVGLEREIPARLLVPMCPRCGDSRVVHDDGRARLRCRRCRADLYTLRPRSYAEMEGLVPEADPCAHTAAVSRGLLAFARGRLRRLRVKLGMR